MDLAAAVGGFILIGWLVDRSTGHYPRYTVVGAVLGLIGGMYNLIRQSLSFTRRAREEERDERNGPGGPRS
jgi:F0F1-type ATP synthase assembly protein I